MNLAETFLILSSRQNGRGFGGRANVLPVELKLGKLDLWPAIATAFAASTGVLAELDGKAVTPTDLAALVRTGFISAGSGIEDAEALLLKAVEVLRAVRTTTAEAYGKARLPTPDIDTASIAADCDDMPHPGRRGRPYKKGDKDRDDHT